MASDSTSSTENDPADERRKTDGNWRMYSYWVEHQNDRGGHGPKASEIAAACSTTHSAAREALRRYRRGRIPTAQAPGLSIKSVRNVHVVMRRALEDAMQWGYLHTNPAAHAAVPRARTRQARRKRGHAWTIEQLGRWLNVALQDHYDAIWLLAATTGMRRSELAGLQRSTVDLDGRWLTIQETRVVLAGQATSSDGKSEAGDGDISLDTYTVDRLRQYLARIDAEREAFGDDYPDHDYLMVGPEGRPLHPDTITAGFNRLVDRAGVPRIRLHDVRHTYATVALDDGQNVKILSERIGHADPSVTHQIYTHRSRGRDRALAQELGALIEQAIRAARADGHEALGTDSGTALTESRDTRPTDENGAESSSVQAAGQ